MGTAPPQVRKTPAPPARLRTSPTADGRSPARLGCSGGPGAAPEALLPLGGHLVPSGQAVQLAGGESATPA